MGFFDRAPVRRKELSRGKQYVAFNKSCMQEFFSRREPCTALPIYL